ncbi:hypothetical protein B2J77_02440 [Pseudomonas parafulva]|uniref:Uncharacterized protein n=1 Tax=Pseudomonas parafulva TaxID=157782 RepID=A0ABN4XRZ9_9PSED|nr:hypothetical protein B2J77_02440 [Pseudomonas parafulva]MBA5708814.1 hypothetical protein [Pseudomonas fulva]
MIQCSSAGLESGCVANATPRTGTEKFIRVMVKIDLIDISRQRLYSEPWQGRRWLDGMGAHGMHQANRTRQAHPGTGNSWLSSP